jgi:hypothetical protein
LFGAIIGAVGVGWFGRGFGHVSKLAEGVPQRLGDPG